MTRKHAIYTIGHSNHTWDRFVELLAPHKIEMLVDVRSNPYSRFAPWSNRENLADQLVINEINYLWVGDRLGGMPRGSRRDADPDRESIGNWYSARLTAPDFLAAITEVSRLAMEKRIALMCSEGDPARCHRTLLLSPVFSSAEFDILHILPKPAGTAVRMELM